MSPRVDDIDFKCTECGHTHLVEQRLCWIYWDTTRMDVSHKEIEYPMFQKPPPRLGDYCEYQPKPIFICANCRTPLTNSEGRTPFTEKELYETLKEKGMLHAE